MIMHARVSLLLFFNAPATPDLYTDLHTRSLPYALPISGVRLSRAYLAGMKKKNWGRVVFISSESGVQIPVEMIHYGVTKTAQIGLARGLAEHRSEEHTSELQSLMRITYAVFCLQTNTKNYQTQNSTDPTQQKKLN